VLVDMRARLAASEDPRRLFWVALDAASAAGLVGAKRVLDSTPLYDAVATMDTITLIRSAIRGLLKAAAAADPVLHGELRAALASGDEYLSNSKPRVDWDDRAAREELIDSRARDGYALLSVLDDRLLEEGLAQAAVLLATVLGQDLETLEDGKFRIARRVAKGRVISTVDPESRHGHKTAARGFDGYKGHVAADPDSEIITDTEVSAGNVGDAAVAADLIDDLLNGDQGEGDVEGDAEGEGGGKEEPDVYGDAAYGSGEFQDTLANATIGSHCKTQPPSAPAGRFAKDQFDVDLKADTVTCPAGHRAPIRRDSDGDGIAYFGSACTGCPLRAQCSTARDGRSIKVGRYEQRLADAASSRRTRPGSRSTARPDPKWNANLGT